MKKVLSSLLLISLLLGIGYEVNKITLNKEDTGCSHIYNYYQLEKDKMDVLFLGSSHSYFNTNTCLLYDDFGITGYDLGGGAQPPWITYYFLEEALKTQSPKAVVYDIYTTEREDDKFDHNILMNLITMKPSLTKWNAIKTANFNNAVDELGVFFSFPYCHERYTELTEQDFADGSVMENYNGYTPKFSIIAKKELQSIEAVDADSVTKEKKISERKEEYIRKIIELCREEEIPLLFVNAPWPQLDEEAQQMYNYVEGIAEEYDVPFIDGNKKLEEMQIDYAEDAADASHLNYWGSRKYTAYLAKYLKEHYELPDRRGDQKYSHWEEISSQLEHRELYKYRLTNAEDLEGYVEELKSLKDCVIAFQIVGDCGEYREQMEELLRQLDRHGTLPDSQTESQVIEDGETLFCGLTSEGGYFWHFDLKNTDMSIEKGEGQGPSIIVGKENYGYVENGINIVVYDKTAECVVDSVGFDAKEDLKEVR